MGFTFKDGKMITYKNSLFDNSKIIIDFNLTLNVPREICYFGKSRISSDQTGDYELDDVKIFNKELNGEDLKSEFKFGYFKKFLITNKANLFI